MTHLTKNDDLIFGLNNEVVILKEICERYPNTFKTTDNYAKFDFRNNVDMIDFELKSRRIYKGQYPTIFFCEKKLIEGRANLISGISKRVIYLFNFISPFDKTLRELWYWEDDGTDLEITMCGSYQRGEKTKRLANVPMEFLTKW